MRESTEQRPNPTTGTSATASRVRSTESATKKALLAAIKAEMAIFESKGTRGRLLQQTYDYLLSIPATSVEAERAFSVAGLFCTKVRSRLGDKSLDVLCFLRTYYQAKRRGQ